MLIKFFPKFREKWQKPEKHDIKMKRLTPFDFLMEKKQMVYQLPQLIFFIKDAERTVGKPRVTLRRWWREKKFPEPKLINGRLCWRADVIHEWIDENLGVTNG